MCTHYKFVELTEKLNRMRLFWSKVLGSKNVSETDLRQEPHKNVAMFAVLLQFVVALMRIENGCFIQKLDTTSDYELKFR